MTWARTEAGKRIPLDPDEVEDGNVVVVSPRGAAETVVRIVAKGQGHFRSHFSSCPQARNWRRSTQAPEAESIACCCGKSHPVIVQVEAIVEDKGVDVTIATVDGSWRVPRRYIAHHGLRSVDVPELAEQYGWVQT